MLRRVLPLILAFSLFTVACSKKNQSSEAQPGNASQTASQQQQPPAQAQTTPGQAQPAPMVPPPAQTQTATSTPPPAPRAQKKAPMPQSDVTSPAKPFSGTEKQAAAKPAATPAPVVVPAGTNITVRLSQTIDAKNNKAGDPFHGTVASPVVVKGQTLIPASAPVSGTVVSATAPGRFSGEGKLSIHLTRVTIHGTSYPITTSALTTSVQGKGKRSAVMVGGGTGAGALIGGLAGGGKGAAIGALIGAGGGAAGAGLTGNKVVGFPAESALTFKLEHAIDLTKRPSNTTAEEETAPPQNEEPQLEQRQPEQTQQPPQQQPPQ